MQIAGRCCEGEAATRCVDMHFDWRRLTQIPPHVNGETVLLTRSHCGGLATSCLPAGQSQRDQTGEP